jgi:hypothetical protein
MKLNKKDLPKVAKFEKDTDLKGYNLILKDGYTFLDGSQYEYVETQTELKDFMKWVKKEGKL